jgi:hypothetical protein
VVAACVVLILDVVRKPKCIAMKAVAKKIVLCLIGLLYGIAFVAYLCDIGCDVQVAQFDGFWGFDGRQGANSAL